MGIIIEVLFTFINFLTANPTSIEFEKIEREYYLFKPKFNVEPSPLVVNLHGYGSNALQQRIYTQFNKFALPKNIYVVYPEGVNRSWNAGIDPNNTINDVGFINALLDTIIANNNIDISKIYVCGFSNVRIFYYFKFRILRFSYVLLSHFECSLFLRFLSMFSC